MITGESIPVIKSLGQKVVGGCINGNGSLTIEVTATGANTVLAGIIHMVDQAQSSKLPIQKTVDKISAVFVPSVVILGGLTFGAWLLAGAGFTTAFATGITVLPLCIRACDACRHHGGDGSSRSTRHFHPQW
jgi:Cu+-exporting ATPase